MEIRDDDIENFISGLGGATYGRSGASVMRRRRSLSVGELDTIWEQMGLGAKLSEIPADDMVREGFVVKDAEDVKLAEVDSALEDVGASRQVRDLYWQGSHYGGALLIAAVNDGVPSAEPLDFRRIESVEGFVVLDRHSVMPLRLGGGPPEAYAIVSSDMDIPIEDRVVHASRVMKYNGPVTLTRRREASRDYWGSPVLNRVWLQLRSIWTSLGYAEELLHDMSVDVFTIPGLQEAVIAGNSDHVRKRVGLAARMKSILRALVLDGGNKEVGRAAEELKTHSRSAAGVADVLNQFWPAFTAGGRIPESRLLGRTRPGLNSGSNEGEHRAWDSDVRALQRTLATPWINWMLEIMFSAKSGPTNGVVPETWTIEHNDLTSPTEREQAETYKIRSDGDLNYAVGIGSVSSSEVRQTRNVEGSTGPIMVESADLPDLPEDDGE